MKELIQRLPEIASLVASQGVPLLISWYKGNTWSDRKKMLLTIAISLLIGLLTTLATNAWVLREGMTFDDWIDNALVVFFGAVAAYKLYFQNTDRNKKLEQQGPFSVSKPQVKS